MWQLLSRNRKLNSFQIIIYGFAAVILVGTFLLMLPISTVERVSTPFLESLFTSTSAVCVTGLIFTVIVQGLTTKKIYRVIERSKSIRIRKECCQNCGS